MSYHLPFEERKTPLRGWLDLATGCYPGFLFGAGTGALLPVFHFHDVTPQYLAPYLQYLADNQYRTVVSDDIWRLAHDGVQPGARTVALCFDDAWASIWTIVYPMLKRHNMRAITYAVPARVPDAPDVRPAYDELDLFTDHAGAPAHAPLATWPELRAMHNSGVIDVQAHTLSHAMVFSHDQPTGFVTPAYAPPALAAPLINDGAPPRFLSAADWGHPLYPARSRCADVRRFYPEPGATAACQAHVRDNGGANYFRQPDWEQPLREIMRRGGGHMETFLESENAITHETAAAREILNAQLHTDAVRHLCFPWAVAGQCAEKAARHAGYQSAFADRLFGKRAVRAGDNPFRLMRLKHQFIFALPGRARRNFFQLRRK